MIEDAARYCWALAKKNWRNLVLALALTAFGIGVRSTQPPQTASADCVRSVGQ